MERWKDKQVDKRGIDLSFRFIWEERTKEVLVLENEIGGYICNDSNYHYLGKEKCREN